MSPVVVLRNERDAPAGYLGAVLDRRGVDWLVVRLDAGDPLPGTADTSAVVVLGGAMGVHDEEAFPFLSDEKRFLRACLAEDVPIFGICLGCQMLADMLGGRAYRAESAEIVFAPVELTPAGRADPVISTLADRRVMRFHEDTYDPPPGAVVLANGGGFDQAFRVGQALGLQPHPEVTPELLGGWLGSGSGRDLAIRSGFDPDGIVEAFTAAEEDVEATATTLFNAWLDTLP